MRAAKTIVSEVSEAVIAKASPSRLHLAYTIRRAPRVYFKQLHNPLMLYDHTTRACSKGKGHVPTISHIPHISILVYHSTLAVNRRSSPLQHWWPVGSRGNSGRAQGPIQLRPTTTQYRSMSPPASCLVTCVSCPFPAIRRLSTHSLPPPLLAIS